MKVKTVLFFGDGRRYYKTENFLLYVAETVKHFGFVKSDSYDRSTKERASDYYLLKEYGHKFGFGIDAQLEKEMDEVSFDPFSSENKLLLQNAMRWIADQPESENDYIHNLKVACSIQYTDFRRMGILASLFQAYHKDMQHQEVLRKQQEKLMLKKDASNFVGKVGDRIEIGVHSVECVTSWETEWGVTKIYKITDAAGNVYIWKTGTFIDDGIKTIRGTIKDHREYKGVKQTEITRCKVA